MDAISATLPLGAVGTTMLAGVRIAAFLVVAPPFSHKAIPARVRVILALGLALAVSPRLGSATATGTATFVLDLVLQAVVGAALGFLVYLVFAAVEAAGGLVDLFGGFQLGSGFDPLSMTGGAQFARLFQVLAMVLLVVSDGHHLVLGGLVRSFEALPLGTAPDTAALAASVTERVTDLMVAALQIAGPLVVVLFLADVALGLLTRVAPALNAFALGFPLKVLLTIALAGLALLALPQAIATLTVDAVSTVGRVASS